MKLERYRLHNIFAVLPTCELSWESDCIALSLAWLRWGIEIKWMRG